MAKEMLPSKRNILLLHARVEVLTKERDEALDKLAEANNEILVLRDRVTEFKAGALMLQETNETLRETLKTLRTQLDDVRRDRDRAREQASENEGRRRGTEIDLSRALGWIDAKRDIPPSLDQRLEIPF